MSVFHSLKWPAYLISKEGEDDTGFSKYTDSADDNDLASDAIFTKPVVKNTRLRSWNTKENHAFMKGLMVGWNHPRAKKIGKFPREETPYLESPLSISTTIVDDNEPEIGQKGWEDDGRRLFYETELFTKQRQSTVRRRSAIALGIDSPDDDEFDDCSVDCQPTAQQAQPRQLIVEIVENDSQLVTNNSPDNPTAAANNNLLLVIDNNVGGLAAKQQETLENNDTVMQNRPQTYHESIVHQHAINEERG